MTYFPPENEDEGPTLPEGCTPEKLEELVASIVDAAKYVGLYADAQYGFEVDGDHLHLMMHFDVGDLAFAKKVQAPEQDKADDVVERYEADATRDRAQEIIERFTDDGPAGS